MLTTVPRSTRCDWRCTPAAASTKRGAARECAPVSPRTYHSTCSTLGRTASRTSSHQSTLRVASPASRLAKQPDIRKWEEWGTPTYRGRVQVGQIGHQPGDVPKVLQHVEVALDCSGVTAAFTQQQSTCAPKRERAPPTDPPHSRRQFLACHGYECAVIVPSTQSTPTRAKPVRFLVEVCQASKLERKRVQGIQLRLNILGTEIDHALWSGSWCLLAGAEQLLSWLPKPQAARFANFRWT